MFDANRVGRAWSYLELHRLERDRSAGCGLVYEITEQIRGGLFLQVKAAKYIQI